MDSFVPIKHIAIVKNAPILHKFIRMKVLSNSPLSHFTLNSKPKVVEKIFEKESSDGSEMTVRLNLERNFSDNV